MIVKDFEVVPVLTKAFCSECNREMKRVNSSVGFPSEPTKYTYECADCGITETSKDFYPTINFKEVNND